MSERSASGIGFSGRLGIGFAVVVLCCLLMTSFPGGCLILRLGGTADVAAKYAEVSNIAKSAVLAAHPDWKIDTMPKATFEPSRHPEWHADGLVIDMDGEPHTFAVEIDFRQKSKPIVSSLKVDGR